MSGIGCDAGPFVGLMSLSSGWKVTAMSDQDRSDVVTSLVVEFTNGWNAAPGDFIRLRKLYHDETVIFAAHVVDEGPFLTPRSNAGGDRNCGWVFSRPVDEPGRLLAKRMNELDRLILADASRFGIEERKLDRDIRELIGSLPVVSGATRELCEAGMARLGQVTVRVV